MVTLRFTAAARRSARSLVAADAADIKPRPELFTAGQLPQFEAEAERLNQARAGDQAGFYLRKR